MGHVHDDPVWYFATRPQQAARLWIASIDKRGLAGPGPGPFLRLRATYPFAVSFVTFGTGLPLSVALLRKNGLPAVLAPAGGIAAYAWLHVPMSIQARYLVPVHLPTLLVLAYAVGVGHRLSAKAQTALSEGR